MERILLGRPYPPRLFGAIAIASSKLLIALDLPVSKKESIATIDVDFRAARVD